jgi:DNA-binding MarR family transcriptional regulator
MKREKSVWAPQGMAGGLSWANYRDQGGVDTAITEMRDGTRAEMLKRAAKKGVGVDHIAELTSLISECYLLHGQLNNLFSTVKDSVDMTGMESLTLFAIVNSDKPVTIPQIGRSLGHARQVIQRAANALEARGLVRTMENPGHKRAAFVVATEEGKRIKQSFDAAGYAIASTLAGDMDLQTIRTTHAGLSRLRSSVEARGREVPGKTKA